MAGPDENIEVLDTSSEQGLDVVDTSDAAETSAGEVSSGDGEASLIDHIASELELKDEDPDELKLDDGEPEAKDAEPDTDSEPSNEEKEDEAPPAEEADAEAETQPDEQPQQKQGWQAKMAETGRFDDADLRNMRRLGSQTREKIQTLVNEHQETTRSHETLTQLTGYLEKKHIDQPTLEQALEIASAWRMGDMKGFREAIQPMIQFADEYLGTSLPADIQQRVDDGEMTQEVARDFARTRHEREMFERGQQQADQRFVQQRDQGQALQRVQAVDSWESEQRRTDPDFDKKWPMMADLLKREAPRLQNLTPQQAVQECQQLYDQVTGWLRESVAPQRRSTKPVPASPASSRDVQAEPQNMMEAALAGLNRAQSRSG